MKVFSHFLRVHWSVRPKKSAKKGDVIARAVREREVKQYMQHKNLLAQSTADAGYVTSCSV